MTSPINDTGASRLQLFLRAAAGDFLLVFIASVGLVLTVAYAFESAQAISANPLIVSALVFPMLLILYAGSWSKRALVFSAAGAVVYAACVLGVCVAITPSDVSLFVDAQINDVAESYAIFGVVVVVVPVLVYLLSRRRTGMVLLFMAAVIACGAVQFLYRDWVTAQAGVPISLTVLLALGALFVFQSYRLGVYGSARIKRTAFLRAAGFSALLSLVCLGLGCAIFFGVISGLGLTTPEIKPFEDYYFRPVVEYSGVYSEEQVDNPDLTTNQLNDEDDVSNQDAEGGEDAQSPQDNDAQGSNPVASFVQQIMSLDMNDWSQQFQAVSYERLQLGALIVALVVLALVIVAVCFQRSRRERRLAKLSSEPLEMRIWTIYHFLLNRFERLRIVRLDALTLMEFAMATRLTLDQFARDTGGLDFLSITLIYQRACYDKGRVSEEDWAAVKRFYRAFFANARAYVGKFRWLVVFWRM